RGPQSHQASWCPGNRPPALPPVAPVRRAAMPPLRRPQQKSRAVASACPWLGTGIVTSNRETGSGQAVAGRCPLWVNSGHLGASPTFSPYPQKGIFPGGGPCPFGANRKHQTSRLLCWAPSLKTPRKGAKRGRPPLPPFTVESAAQKARMAED